MPVSTHILAAACCLLAATPSAAQPGHADERNEGRYDPATRYRDGSSRLARILAPDERVYRGRDGIYYCRRTDGSTGLLVDAIDGFLLGDAIRHGHSRTVRTLVADYSVKVEGHAWTRLDHEIRCR